MALTPFVARDTWVDLCTARILALQPALDPTLAWRMANAAYPFAGDVEPIEAAETCFSQPMDLE